MRKLFLLITIIIYPFGHTYSQDLGVSDSTRDLIQKRVTATIGSECGVEDVIYVDSTLKPISPEGGIEDPYHTLIHYFVFTYSRVKPIPNIVSESNLSVGIFRDGKVIAKLDTAIETFASTSGRIEAIRDLNNDGKVDIVISRILGVHGPFNESFWIVSWDGFHLRLINAKNKTQWRSVIIAPYNCLKYVDIDSDGVYELTTSFENEKGIEKKVIYSWNGKLYGDWGKSSKALLKSTSKIKRK
ncbi:MAG: hypothetical protein ABR936_17320 [Bacteroidota bacterium]